MDQAVLNIFLGLRSEWLTWLMLVITDAGGYLAVIAATLVSVLLFLLHKHHKKALGLLISVLGSASSVYLLKLILGKTRPLVEAFYTETTFSFPSGHSAMALALYGFLFVMLLKEKGSPFKPLLLIVLGALILAIGISRLYLGVHYLSDVLGGYLVGLVWLFISFKIQKYFSRAD